jgi:hypothetical protein
MRLLCLGDDGIARGGCGIAYPARASGARARRDDESCQDGQQDERDGLDPQAN